MQLKRLAGSIVLLSSISAPASAAYLDDLGLDPFGYFHVYSLGDIGTAAAPYRSDFQGVTGAAGDVHTRNFTFYNLENREYTLHAGGSAFIENGTHTGSLDAGADALLRNVKWNGDVYLGGSLLSNTSSGWGTINGDVFAEGTIGSRYSSGGARIAGTAYTPLFDFLALNNYFLNASSMLGAMLATGDVTIRDDGVSDHLSVNVGSGDHVFSLTAEQMLRAHTFAITAPADAVIYINVNGEDADLDSITWQYLGGISAGNVIVNYTNASRLDLSGGNSVNILAPLADVFFSTGLVTGNLIAGGLFGGGQVNLGHFTGGIPETTTTPPSHSIPSPGTLPALLLGLLALVGAIQLRKFKD